MTITDSRLDRAAELVKEARDLVDEVEEEIDPGRHPHGYINLMRAQKFANAALRAVNAARNGEPA